MRKPTRMIDFFYGSKRYTMGIRTLRKQRKGEIAKLCGKRPTKITAPEV